MDGCSDVSPDPTRQHETVREELPLCGPTRSFPTLGRSSHRRRLVAPPALSPGGVGRTVALHVNHGSNTCFVRTHCTHRRKVPASRSAAHDDRDLFRAPIGSIAWKADDPWYIAYQDESTQWCIQRMDLEKKVANLGDELAHKNLMIFELKRIVEEEKKNSELIRKEKLRVETDLVVFDQVVENLEHELQVMGEEKSRFIWAVMWLW
ncbi:hypothetical protein QYE76_028199 [Lolium multiflorum]|uniref:Uncharacterized protein n=1 Tax=Lolium multiflorum TaxID=4521 RepID=A0AAD8QLU9_LOLMU|nr:hypothetical protein QYE76_028199 [Lolium multiflorum]